MPLPTTSPPDPSPPAAAQSSRRRLLQVGVASAPVLMTLASRPVLGVQCAAASASVSLGASRPTSVASCAGKSPSAWADTKTWPDPYHATDKQGAHGYDATLYHCLTTGLNGTTFSSSTMLAVIEVADDAGVRSLGRYIATALLNARLGLTPVLSESYVRMMWNDFVARGYFEPTAGVRWGAAEIVAYIKTTIA